MNATQLFINAIDHWRDAKGVGTAIIPAPLDDRGMILGILQKMYNKNDEIKVLIITSNFKERESIIEYLTNQPDEENNAEFKRLIELKSIWILTSSYIETLFYYPTPILTILYRCNTISDKVFKKLKESKFKLAIFNKFKLDIDSINKLYSICPLLSDFKQNEIDSIRTSTPVEEHRIGVLIDKDSEDFKLLLYYDEYISTSMYIFTSFDNIEYARVGDSKNNISATQFCYNLALSNGWDPHLDMSVELNVKIDEAYNPTNIRERANQTYEIMRNRKKLLANYKGKFDEILKIIQDNPNKNILIINKYSEFAAKVTEYINNMSEKDMCGNYHDNVEPIPATNIVGTPIYIKSGKHKGERKMIAAQAQKTLNEEKFRRGLINVLSTNNSPDKDLNANIDIVIITSPECEEIESYIYRLSNVTYQKNKIILYSIYVQNSTEEKRLQQKRLSETHKVIESVKMNADNVKFENNFDFIVGN